MKMFVWHSGFLTDYTDGLGVAVAETVEEARAILIYQATDRWEKDEITKDAAREPDRIVELPAAAYCRGSS